MLRFSRFCPTLACTTPDLSRLKVFGSRVCVKQAGERSGKLDHNDFTGIFLGYTATDQNVQYIDLTSGIVKTSHHVDFDEAWYLQSTRPPAAQLLYDLGLGVDEPTHPTNKPTDPPHESSTPLTESNLAALGYITWHPPMLWRHQPLNLVTTNVPWPPLKSPNLPTKWGIPPQSCITPLPLCKSATPVPHRPHTAAAPPLTTTTYPTPATILQDIPTPSNDLFSSICLCGTAARTKALLASELVSEYLITRKDIAPIYMSPCPYFDSFEEELNLRKFNLTKHRTAGLCLTQVDGRLILGGMASSTLGTKIPRWHTRLKGAWLIKIGDLTVHTIADAQALGVHPSHYLTFFSPRDSTCNDARRPPYHVLCSIPSTCTRSDKSPLGLGHSRCSLGQGPTFLSCPRRQRHQLCNKGYETHTG
jgi:hypothetical protein